MQTYKSDQQLCDAVSNSSTYALPDGLTCVDVPARLSAATEVQTAARALVTAENQMASSQAQSKQTLDNAQASVTDAITAQSATLLEGPAGDRHRAASARVRADELQVDAGLERRGRLARDRE